MKKLILVSSFSLLGVLALAACSSSPTTGTSAPPIDAATLYRANCATCHGDSRQGGVGPALNKATIGGDAPTEVANDISNGETEGPVAMPPFSSKLSVAQISALVTYIQQPAVTP